MEVFADAMSRSPLEIPVVVRLDVRVSGSRYALAVRSVPSSDSFQRLISSTQDQGRR